MAWTGHQAPERLTVKTVFEHGQLVRETITAESGGGLTVTDIRCTCRWSQVGCTLHGKERAS